jgi:hypothetical protein
VILLDWTAVVRDAWNSLLISDDAFDTLAACCLIKGMSLCDLFLDDMRGYFWIVVEMSQRSMVLVVDRKKQVS